MKFPIFVTLSAAALAVLTAAAPSIPIRHEVTRQDYPGANELRIHIEMSKNFVNVGNTSRPALYDQVYHALENICPISNEKCGGPSQKTTHFMVPVAAHGRDPNDIGIYSEPIRITVDKAWWNRDPKVYYLLVGAVAGAFERGTYSPDNCWDFKTKGDGETHRHCNSADYVAVAFPGQHHMFVHFQGSSNTGRYNCGKVINYAAEYMDELQPQIEAVRHLEYYVVADCV